MEKQFPTVLFLCSGNYYRSRFAEILFNHLSHEAALPFRADSAGLTFDCWTRNPGPISQHAIEGLLVHGVPLPLGHRPPRDVTAEDLRRVWIAVALKESEHRPLIRARFPAFENQVRYWDVDDTGSAPPAIALCRLERYVRDLVAELAGQTWEFA